MPKSIHRPNQKLNWQANAINKSNYDDARLSRIETLWSVVRRAHENDGAMAEPAQQLLLKRYGAAIRRYLLAAVRDQHVADELFQEFAVKLIKGDFKQVDPEFGKFRSYVKTTLFRMVAAHYRKRTASKEHNLEQLPDVDLKLDEPDSAEDEEFLLVWREGILARAWSGLAAEESSGGTPFHTVLRLRVQNPAATSTILADLISNAIGKTITGVNARVQVHRAREKFAHCLFDAIAESLENPTREAVEAELIDVRLIEYCRDAFDGYQFANNVG